MLMKEKRKFVRVNKLLNVTYRIPGENPREGKSLTQNISGGGFRFMINEGLEVGTLLEVEIALPDALEPILAKGRVAWIEKLQMDSDPGGDYFEAGVNFEEIGSVEKSRIFSFVYESVKARAGKKTF